MDNPQPFALEENPGPTYNAFDHGLMHDDFRDYPGVTGDDRFILGTACRLFQHLFTSTQPKKTIEDAGSEKHSLVAISSFPNPIPTA
ncbi:hypothetical protein [Thioalkalivibrio sp. ALE30]|uniref:hypothetical protein n=1 Tax=Thioalkalivibrio sp. ALE30 TaxID=1158181 RepID=UPI0012DDCF4E|nr:hypothetical protein [Thioalkalivibrio sp. ALE30]